MVLCDLAPIFGEINLVDFISGVTPKTGDPSKELFENQKSQKTTDKMLYKKGLLISMLVLVSL